MLPRIGMWLRQAFIAAFLLVGPLTERVLALELNYVSHLQLYYPDIGMSEPSGLAADPGGAGFWLVSDNTESVFELTSDGELRAMIGRDKRLRDLEGIAVDVLNERLLLVSERNASVIAVSLQPPHRIKEFEISGLSLPNDIQDFLADPKDGLEGITADAETGAVYLLKEMDPRLLIELAPTLDRVVSVQNLDEILPSGGDVSGLANDPDRGGFWIVSDTGRTVHFLSHMGNSLATFELSWRSGDVAHRLENAEGVALSPDGRYLFVVTDDDRHSRIVQYEIVEN